MQLVEQDLLSFRVDGDALMVRYDCGWNAPIVRMLDEDDECTEDFDEAVILYIKMPNGVMQLDLLGFTED